MDIGKNTLDDSWMFSRSNIISLYNCYDNLYPLLWLIIDYRYVSDDVPLKKIYLQKIISPL